MSFFAPVIFGVTVIDMLLRSKNIVIIRACMLLINCIIILFMAAIINTTTGLICYNDSARDFLEKIKYVPNVPWKVYTYSLAMFTILLLTIIIREKILAENKPAHILLSILDVFLCLTIMYYLNLSYKGVLLIVITNAVVYYKGRRYKYLFVITIIFLYIIIDYDIFSLHFPLFTLNDYIEYYTPSQRLYLFSIRNVLTSLNEVLFIVSMITYIQRQIDENIKIKELNSELFKQAKELKILNIQVEEYGKRSEELAKLKERNRLARDIHDTVGHTLTGIDIGIKACLELIKGNVEKTKDQLAKISELAQEGIRDIRRSINELKPDSIQRYSLEQALEHLVDHINGASSTEVKLIFEGTAVKLHTKIEEIVYRTVQESITNSVKHGDAGLINIRFTYSPKNVRVVIEDNGRGKPGFKEGFGLTSMRERVKSIHGEVEFSSLPEKGFLVKVTIPLDKVEEKI